MVDLKASSTKKEPILREANLDDEGAVQALSHRNGLPGEQSELAWQWLWLDNPFCPKDWPLGWVLEANKGVVGFIGNIPRSYFYKGKEIIVGAAHSFSVDAEFRSHTFQLLAAFFSRNPANVFLFSSANELAAPLFRVAGAKMLPQQDYNNSLFWVISWADFVSSALRKRGHGKAISTVAGSLSGPILAVERILKQRWKSHRHPIAQFMHPSEASSEFDGFWESLVAERPGRFLARRDCDSLKWQFGHPAAAPRQPIILCSRINGRLAGYTILTRWDSPALGLRRLMVTDLIALNNDGNVARNLIAAAYKYARDERVHVLQMMGFPPLIRRTVEIFKPIKQSYSVLPFWYFAKDTDVAADLSRPETWYASMMDGDSTL
ncbi:MAG: hypothetical protein ACYDH2_14365 [Anaerolineaceae bacterium]